MVGIRNGQSSRPGSSTFVSLAPQVQWVPYPYFLAGCPIHNSAHSARVLSFSGSTPVWAWARATLPPSSGSWPSRWGVRGRILAMQLMNRQLLEKVGKDSASSCPAPLVPPENEGQVACPRLWKGQLAWGWGKRMCSTCGVLCWKNLMNRAESSRAHLWLETCSIFMPA